MECICYLRNVQDLLAGRGKLRMKGDLENTLWICIVCGENGDIFVADIDELENLGVSEIHARRDFIAKGD